MTDQQTTKRPKWSLFVAFGFFVAAFGFAILAISLFAGAPLAVGFGGGIIAAGGALACLGAYGYFMEYRANS
jgi:hypothetical protein